MEIDEINKKFNSLKYTDVARQSFFDALESEKYLLTELETNNIDGIELLHKETSIVLFQRNGYQTFLIKYSFDIFILEDHRSKGYYNYLIDLQGNFKDEFLVIM